jgi:hypothetical protein
MGRYGKGEASLGQIDGEITLALDELRRSAAHLDALLHP